MDNLKGMVPIFTNDMNLCCQYESNRTAPEVNPENTNFSFTTCKECGCRHFELVVDPLKLGVTGSELRG